MPDDGTQQHGDSNHAIINPNVDKLDSTDFRGGLVSAIEKVRSGDIVPQHTRRASPDQRSEETPADSRGSDDDFSDTDDDMSDASEIWDESLDKPDRIDDPDDEDQDEDEDDEAGEDDDEDMSSLDDDEADEADEDLDDDTDDAGGGEDADDEEDGPDKIKLSAKDRRELQKNPAARKLAASLQKHATEKYMELADRERELKQGEAQQQDFLNRMNSPQHMADFMGDLMEMRPDICSAAFEKVLTGGEQVDALVEIGLGNPKALQAANDKIELLQSDKDAMRNHEDRIKLKLERQEVQVQKAQMVQRRLNRETARLEGVLEREISRARIPKGYHDRVTKDFRNRLRDRVDQKEGTIDFPVGEIRDLVQENGTRIQRDRKYAVRVLRREEAKTGQKATKQKATKNRNRRRSSPPRSSAPKRPAPSKPKKRGRKAGMSFDQMVQQEVMRQIG